ncbi:hypothetical protein VTK73DRAFT_9399 [Phialemonium thermophilum]|uniref:Transmembrane protein n=1 Tax=Phialemonium thermophilum TaxID=223376 RepID=A0ABR3XK82_9PEZI
MFPSIGARNIVWSWRDLTTRCWRVFFFLERKKTSKTRKKKKTKERISERQLRAIGTKNYEGYPSHLYLLFLSCFLGGLYYHLYPWPFLGHPFE